MGKSKRTPPKNEENEEPPIKKVYKANSPGKLLKEDGTPEHTKVRKLKKKSLSLNEQVNLVPDEEKEVRNVEKLIETSVMDTEVSEDISLNETNKISEKELINGVIEEEVDQAERIIKFSVKEFRKQLHTPQCTNALEDFITVCARIDTKSDSAQDYLENGGSCSELMQLLESEANVPQNLILEATNYVLIKIISDCRQQDTKANDTCKKILNSHKAIINKMLGQDSSPKERLAVLKLLTTIVMFSDSLAKEVLAHINVYSAMLETLTKQTTDGNNLTVRNTFIHFLIAFLVNGHYPVIAKLLEKRGLLTSIIRGLQYDTADDVCLVFSTIKKNILENLLVSKTVKMKTFHTTVVKDIVNLYNWKGPNKEIDEYDKSRVSEEVHSFLLVLCTSIKFGLIFRDRRLGFGKDNHNALMYTVLVSLDKPWNHSYASDLASKICGACPDLVKTMWSNLKPFLEPKHMALWKRAIEFTKNLLDHIQPNCIQFCARELSVHEYAQSIQMLVAPTHILKTLRFHNFNYKSNIEKHEVLMLIEKMLHSIRAYMEAAKIWYDANFNDTLNKLIKGHIGRYFPQAKIIFQKWDSTNGKEDYKVLDHLQVILNVFELYNELCFELLDSLLENMQFSEVMSQIESLEGDYRDVQVRAIKLLTTLDPELLFSNNDIFPVVVPKILENYHATGNLIAKQALQHVFRNTGIFEGCESEIDLWINALNNVKSFDETLGGFIVSILKKAADDPFKYINEITQLLSEAGDVANLEEIIGELIEEQTGFNDPKITIKPVHFSSLVLAGFECLRKIEAKNLKNYISCVVLNIFHHQSNRPLFNSLINKNEDVVPSSITKYIFSWEDEVQPLQKFKGKISAFELVSAAILQGDASLVNIESYNNHADLLQMVIFYLTNLKHIDDNIYSTCVNLAQSLANHDNVGMLLTQPLLLQQFSPLTSKQNRQNYSTKFVLEMVPFLAKSYDMSNQLKPYFAKLHRQVLKLIKKKKIKNVEKIMDIIKLIEFTYTQCKEILSEISKLDSCSLVEDNALTVVYYICIFSLQRFTEICIKSHNEPLDFEMVTMLGNHLSYLNEVGVDSSILAHNLLGYLQKFLHNYKNIMERLFYSILLREENCKENSELAVHLLRNRHEFITILQENIKFVVSKKGLILPILDSLENIQIPESLKLEIYTTFEASISKALQKPQKAGQHFEHHYTGLCSLIKDCMPEKSAQAYISKIQKYDSTEIFHVNMLKTIFEKFATTDKTVNNSILTCIHLLINLFKRAMKADISIMITPIAVAFNELLKHFKNLAEISYNQVEMNESYKLFCKFCLKFGIGDNVAVLELLIAIIDLIGFKNADGPVFMEMIIAHSEFLNTVLNEETPQKIVLVKLYLLMCQKYEKVMKRKHMPVLLSGYSATLQESDQIILQILKLYESVPVQTNFYDFKPFLWSTAASNHYSVRPNIQRALFKQPRVGDVLEILQESWVLNTIKHHPLDVNFTPTTLTIPSEPVYDLRFLLPLFSHLLAPENNIPVYLFTKSGALSLTLLALSSEVKQVRLVACHILARFYHHLEGRQNHRDNKLWISFVEAVCRGTAVFEEFHLNNFVSIFLARMALIITNPPDVMYLPLSQYLGAKSTPNLSSIPELYTFLHSSDVNFKDHRTFIFNILRDGLRTKKDLKVFSKAMAHKLCMETFTSVVSDLETKMLILDVIKTATNLKSGAIFFCNNYGLLSWLLDIITSNKDTRVLKMVLSIVFNVINSNQEDLGSVKLLLKNIISERLSNDLILILLKCIFELIKVNVDFLDLDLLNVLIAFVGSKDCEYMLKFKQNLPVCESEDSPEFYVKSLTQTWLMKSM